MIGIIDYGMGNIRSVYHAFEMAGADVKVCTRPEELKDADRLVLPGVGAFGDCMSSLRAKGFQETLNNLVLNEQRPILGICLGMQALGRMSFEGGKHSGLGWIEGDVVALTPSDAALRVPQIGWNDIRYRPDSTLFQCLPPSPDFYFVHSFYLKCDDEADVIATCDYGGIVTAAICRNNIFATQFHPEKSQDYGLTVIQNFLNWTN